MVPQLDKLKYNMFLSRGFYCAPSFNPNFELEGGMHDAPAQKICH